jgi:hypothetical protein
MKFRVVKFNDKYQVQERRVLGAWRKLDLYHTCLDMGDWSRNAKGLSKEQAFSILNKVLMEANHNPEVVWTQARQELMPHLMQAGYFVVGVLIGVFL